LTIYNFFSVGGKFSKKYLKFDNNNHNSGSFWLFSYPKFLKALPAEGTADFKRRFCLFLLYFFMTTTTKSSFLS